MAAFKLYFTKYDLHPDSKHGKGFLLRFDHGDKESFYSSLQSWENLDNISSQQLENDILDCRLDNILLDSSFQLARHSKKIFEANEFRNSIKSHLLVSNSKSLSDETIALIMECGFESLKVKVQEELGLSLLDIFYWLNPLDPKIKLRLDFNLYFSKNEVLSAFSKLTPEELERLDWVEDPFSGTMDEWTALSQNLDVKAALDWLRPLEFTERHFPHITKVFKPSLMTLEEKKYLESIKHWEKKDENNKATCLFTSYFAHPLEQLLASVEADIHAESLSDVHGGFCSHNAYPKNRYSELLSVKNALIGLENTKEFLKLLEKEDWKYAGSFG
jgi:hypothetical protein